MSEQQTTTTGSDVIAETAKAFEVFHDWQPHSITATHVRAVRQHTDKLIANCIPGGLVTSLRSRCCQPAGKREGK